jgi:tetratricopeptide (TPR) repeat protein
MVNVHRVSALLDEAQYFEDHGMWLHAVQIYQRLIHESPEEWNFRLKLGNIYLEMGNLQAAEQVLLQALRHDAQNPDILYALGLASYQSGDLDRALYYLQQLAGKGLPKVHYSLGLIYWRRMEFEHAERHFRLALEMEPESCDTAVALGETYLRNGKTREAVEVLRRASLLQPGDDLIERSLSQALLADGKGEEAASVLESIHQRNPDSADASYALAGVWLTLKRTEEAEQLLKASVLRWPGNAELYVLLGKMALLKSNRVRAEEYFRHALVIDPDHEEALEQIRYFASHGNPAI